MRLACLIHAVSIRSEPRSNSQKKLYFDESVSLSRDLITNSTFPALFSSSTVKEASAALRLPSFRSFFSFQSLLETKLRTYMKADFSGNDFLKIDSYLLKNQRDKIKYFSLLLSCRKSCFSDLHQLVKNPFRCWTFSRIEG